MGLRHAKIRDPTKIPGQRQLGNEMHRDETDKLAVGHGNQNLCVLVGVDLFDAPLKERLRVRIAERIEQGGYRRGIRAVWSSYIDHFVTLDGELANCSSPRAV